MKKVRKAREFELITPSGWAVPNFRRMFEDDLWRAYASFMVKSRAELIREGYTSREIIPKRRVK